MCRYGKIILFVALMLVGVRLTADAGGNEQLSLDARKKLSNEDRLKWLERNGEVPKDADNLDWYLSQRTSWWGKPLDPKVFWKGRVVWNDKSAVNKARRHGRWFPPIPTDDPQYAQFSDKDRVSSSPGGVETANFDFHDTDREGVFWDRFSRTQPKPPEKLDHQIVIAANEYFNTHSFIKPDEATLKVLQNGAKNSGKELNYPPEEFTDDALFWAYVIQQRAEYERDMRIGMGTNNPIVRIFFGTLRVDSKFITEPLSADQVKAANAWKVAYLQRLRREKTDESYINAYLKAWNLSSTEVFAESK